MSSITKRLGGWVLATTALGLAPLAAQAAYVLTEIVRPGASTTQLWDVNNAGVMVGYSITGSGPTDYGQGFVFDGTSYTGLTGPAGAITSLALGISDGGTVVGSFASTTTIDPGTGDVILGPSSGFIYQGGVYTVFNIPGANETVLRGISPNGRYVTGYYATDTVPGTGFVHDTLTNTTTLLSQGNSILTIAQGVDNNGHVVGSDLLSGPPTTRPGFRYDPGTGRTDVSIPGAFRTALRAVTEDGFESGWFIDAGGVQHAFAGPLASFEQIDFAGADGTYVEGNNNARWLVGGYVVARALTRSWPSRCRSPPAGPWWGWAWPALPCAAAGESIGVSR